MSIIGRHKECKTLSSVYRSKEAEFVAVYGRRRVGKTFLIREFFKNKGTFFEVVGIKDGNLESQLENFISSVSRVFDDNRSLKTPANWREAFEVMTEHLREYKPKKKVVIFLDELPWMATKRSQFLQNLDHFWNAHWSKMSNIVLVVCGSAASWMLKEIVRAKGGLYNRLTRAIMLSPFSLSESQQYLTSRGIKLNHRQVLDLYMVLGGIPHYLRLVEKGKSAVQVINELCFSQNGLLYDEFNNLFQSLFEYSEEHEAIIRTISVSQKGITRAEILTKAKLKSGGTFNKRLEELIASGFVKQYVPYGQKQNYFYRVIDEYSLFYLRWIEPFKQQSDAAYTSNYWQNKSQENSWVVSSGYLFENVCFKHVPQIQKALGLEKVSCHIGSWRYVPLKGQKAKGAQVDLLFDRADGAITVCEIKYSNGQFVIDKSYGKELSSKLEVFEERLKTDKQLFLAMVTTKGIKKNLWSEELVSRSVVLKDLFVEV